ncbi:alpha-1,6-mannosylglycoprotein 6-beta-N-acetylglucosaminyltransferase A-like [Saccoglossus kowalevskii]|uniref:alpha-1,6-mannosyl-glycoprotein 6-beta-N-acetylglucosaminyltransferase n=1 Tax=Saccoglossus kowalevskii TaxID=10224 RepID=A0ABM0GSL5_SACKO|nr:PREDICTED: alpha-1,6-mannosylglycoprotein 6-beta-N-acetylglucosaminyltransferase A-like [Saccoglossus kowalevskii]
MEPDLPCQYSDKNLQEFVHCRGKIDWMGKYWHTDSCYKHYGVDGSMCSIAIYLSEIENWCPVLPWRKGVPNNLLSDPESEMEPLFKLMADDNKFLWMKNRIDRMWDNKWVPAGKALQMKQDLSNRSKKRQSRKREDAKSLCYMKAKGVSNKNCPVSGVRPVDLIYIDIVGLKQFKKVAGSLWNQFSCMLRVIDTFGTEPAFNLDTYARKAGTKSVWGKWGLVPLQFMTMFPHTPDNSFMGFVVENDLQDEDFERPVPKQNDMAVVYGKKADMWLDSKAYLDIIHERFTLHGTVYANTSDDLMNIPRYVINHGILSGDQVQELLKKAKLFVGLGFPYDGPAPLEAIANGCVFLNPSFNPPLNSMNTKFFKGKPTLRELTSQHPYAEVYIGKPYVHTVSITNTTAFRAVLREIQETEYLKPYVPHEFTPEGMLQRLNAYIENQDFCSANPKQWPPLSALKVKISNPKESCKAVCMKNGLICEPSFFKSLNTQEMIEREGYLECKSVISVEDIYAPSFIKESNICHLEKQKLLFSCAGGSDTRNRVCPCRDFIKGQVSLCKDCL